MFLPTETSMLVVDLPGERLRVTVSKVIDNDTIVVKLTSMPMAKSHQYRMDQFVRCHRARDGMQHEIWEVSGVEQPTLRVVPTSPPPLSPEKPVNKGRPPTRKSSGSK